MDVFGIDPDKRVDVPNGLRRTGVTGGKGIFDKYMNQILFELKANQIWGTESQVKLVPPAATFYTDGSGNPLDKLDASVTINEDDKILVAHDVTATANHVLDCGGKKVTLEMAQGVTWDLDTFGLTLGGTGDSIGGSIRIIQTGLLAISKNRGLSINSSTSTYSDFTTKNLIINVSSVIQAKADADNIIFIDEFGGGKRGDNISVTFDSTTDRPDGLGTVNALLSTWYQMWLDSLGNKALLPDLEGVADADVFGELRDTNGDFLIHLVQRGDIVYNLTDGTQGTVNNVVNDTTIVLNSDLFPTGTQDYKIRMLSPVGLGRTKARLGAAFRNSGGNFDDSTYTQIQKAISYSQSNGDFTITGQTGHSTTFSAISAYQKENSKSKVKEWWIQGSIRFSQTSNTVAEVSISGVTFVQRVGIAASEAAASTNSPRAAFSNNASGVLFIRFSGEVSDVSVSFNVPVTKKPTWVK